MRNPLLDQRRLRAAFRHCAGIDRARGGQRCAQPRGRRIAYGLSCGYRANFQQLHETVTPAQSIGRLQQPQQCGGRQLVRLAHVGVIACRQQRHLAAFLRHTQARAQQLDRRLFRMHRDQPKARGEFKPARGAGIQRSQPACAGNTGKRPGEFRQHDRRRAAFGQHAKHARRLAFHQPAREFLPHALGNQRGGFAVHHHVTHQLQGHGRDREIEARGEPCHAQYAHRVFGERRPDVTQYARFQIGNAAVRVDDFAIGVFGNRVDGEIAARQVLLQSDAGVRVKLEPVIAARGLALGARERVFLFGFGMQKHREILADRFVAELDHFFRRGADHDVIAIGYRQAEQLIAHGTADRVDFHAE